MRRYFLVSLLGALAIALFASAFAEEKEPEMMTGAIVSVDTPTGSFVATKDVSGGKAEEMKFFLGQGAIVRIHGLKGKLDSLKAGDVVTVTYEPREGRNVASAVQHS